MSDLNKRGITKDLIKISALDGSFRTALAILLIFATVASLSCSGNSNNDGGTQTQRLRGVGLSPQGFPLDYTGLASFYAEVGGLGHSVVMWNGAWRDDAMGGTNAGTVPAAAAATAQAGQANGFTPVAVFGWRTDTTLFISVPTNTVNNWSNSVASSLYSATISTYAAAYHPNYVFLGNENDFYYAQDAVDYANWIVAYNAAYDAIKAVSPSTLVGPVFSFEHMAGSGALNGWITSYWGALDAHTLAKVDIIGLTLYPWLNYSDPSKIQASYLDPLFSRIGSKPVAITETGWPAENLGSLNPPWATSEQAQVDYIPVLYSVIGTHDVRLVNWLFLYPMVGDGSSMNWKLFSSVSLRNTAGAKRSAYDDWAAR